MLLGEWIVGNFLLEVGTEDLPAAFVSGALEQWERIIPTSLAAVDLPATAVGVYGTPRRLAVTISDLPVRQDDRTEEVKGPAKAAAFKDGVPTPAAVGFASKQGVDVGSLTVRAVDKGEFVFATKTIVGRDTRDVLQELVPEWIGKLEGKRFMRWGDGDFRFSRPILWLVALWDEAVLPIEIVNGSDRIASDRLSRGHRVLHPEPVSIAAPDSYVRSLAAASVLVDRQERRDLIESGINAAVKGVGGVTEIYPDLLEEVIDLVEYPTAIVGKFDEEFLRLPTETIATVMVTHQRYFPVFADEKKQQLLPFFITISNADPAKKDIVAGGNGRVVRARLADGQYFYDADLKQGLIDYLPKLETVTFQAELGSVRAKVDRIATNATLLCDSLGIDGESRADILRAATLCKADLVTQMVGEFPELQGVMGSKYAVANGESAAVATAIFEHYLPRNSEDGLPQTIGGQIVGIADRLDTLVCIFGVGMLPTGSSDPFALRRAANAIINVGWQANLKLNIPQLMESIVANFLSLRQATDADLLKQQLGDFFLQRLRSLIQEELTIDYDLVNAILGNGDAEYTQRALSDILDARDRALFVQQIRNNGELEQIYETVNRSTNLAAKGTLDKQTLDPKNIVDPNLFEKPTEGKFYDSLVTLLPETIAARENRDYRRLTDSLKQIAPTVSQFFDGEQSVLVMDENPAIKTNRLNLLGLLRNHARVLADFGEIVKSSAESK
jgi:glycyl-tRNA synthetase beta chain